MDLTPIMSPEALNRFLEADFPQLHTDGKVFEVMTVGPGMITMRLMPNERHLRPGGTISGPTKDSRGSLLEMSWGGKEPIAIAGGTRSFIDDNDTLVLRGAARGDGFTIGFGDCAGKVIPALADPYAR